MLIRKNTKAFKTILELITVVRTRMDREKLIRLYITKAGQSITDRISVEGIQGKADIFYDMNYQSVLNNLNSSNHQLHHSDEVPGIYFFHSNANKSWDETPFEFDAAIKKEFAALPELPIVRKKEKPQKFIFPDPKARTETRPTKKEKTEPKNRLKIPADDLKQPSYNLRHKIRFTELKKVISRQAQFSLTKKDVLDYYNKIAEYILPYLKDRPQLIRLHQEHSSATEYLTSEALLDDGIKELPDWIQTARVTDGKIRKHLFLCNDKEHILFFTEIGCLQFNAGHSRVKSLESPDYIVIGIDPPEAAFSKAIEVALVAKEILTGLQLPSFVKTDGISGLHIYIPLDSKSEFETSKNVGEYICKLIRLKVPDLVSWIGAEGYSYGKVTLDYGVNEQGKSVVSPYSILPGQSANVATPLLWEEVNDGLRIDDFNTSTIFKRLKQSGDPFGTLFKNKVNADTLLDRIHANYSFLF